MKVNVISDSVMYPKGFGGIHTAFLNHVSLLESQKVSVEINSLTKTDLVHIHTLGPLGLYHLIAGKQPKIISAHVMPSTFSGTLVGDEIWGFLTAPILSYYFNLADVVIAVSEMVKDELREIGVTTSIIVIPNLVDQAIFRKIPNLRKKTRAKYGFSPNDVIILGAGQMQTRKGIVTFFDMAKYLPEYKFVWAGGKFNHITHQTRSLKNTINTKAENILLIDTVSYTEMPSLYNMADICFFPSFQETSGLVIIEAAACGLPLILRDLPEFRSLYNSGYLSGKNVKDFKHLIQKLVGDKKLYNQMTRQSKRLADKFSFKNQKEILLEHYEKLLQHHRSQ